MVLFPRTGLGRVLVAVIVISAISLLVLNLVSFGGDQWITYVDVPIHFGLWRVCDTSTNGHCNYWTDNNSSLSNVTDIVFASGTPSFINAAKGLEITSLILYVFAVFFTAVGLLDLALLPFQLMFLIAAALLFPCLAFLPAALGVMGNQGRKNHRGAILDWAWWNGLVGLIMTTILFVALLAVILDVLLADRDPNKQRTSGGGLSGGRAMRSSPMMRGPTPTMMGGRSSPSMMGAGPYPPMIGGAAVASSPSSMGILPKSLMGLFSREEPPIYPSNFLDFHPAPTVSALAERYIYDTMDNNYGQLVLYPYRPYLPPSYLMNNYL